MWLQNVVSLPAIGVLSALSAYPAEEIQLAGVWKGESVCLTSASACVNESVIYYVEAMSGKTDEMMVQADKIVDGKVVTMGRGPWKYDRVRRKLEWEASGRVWSLDVEPSRMEGTLTLPNGTVFRKMSLQKLS